MKVFLSFSFSQGEELTRAAERLLSSNDVEIITGRRLGGEQVDVAVEDKIKQADALVSLFTKKQKVKRGEAPFSQSVLQEFYIARNAKLRSIAIVEKGLKLQDMSNREMIPYDPTQPLEAVLRLSETLAEWRREMGLELRVQILPDMLAKKLKKIDAALCSHRLIDKDISTPWKEVPAIPEQEGTFIYLRGVRAGQKIQLRVKEPNGLWQSLARSPWTMIQLEEEQNG